MRDLARFLDNPFDARGISVAELEAFTTDHLARTAVLNTGGEWTARLAATQSAYDLFATHHMADLVKLGLRKASKDTKDEFRAGLLPRVAQVEAAIIARYGPNTPVLLECFPFGRTIFSQCPDDGVTGHLNTMITGVTAHQADLGAPLVASATAIKTEWLVVYDASEDSTGAKVGTQAAKKLSRDNLQLMLYLNLVKLMEMFPRQPEKLALYMTQSLLEDHPAAPEPPPVPPGP